MQYLILPLIAALIAQTVKFFIKSNQEKFSWWMITSYSGMPSAHAALVTSLVTIIGLKNGILSPLFAISLVFAVIVLRDAVGIRSYLGEHGRILNELVSDLKEEPDQPLDKTYPHLLEKIGHTPAQAAVGILIGFLVSLIGFWL
ncbi:MAG TPA: divergent PAP2 family protein [Candidatus Nanoarchaeia archaeon]|nr:divergent PAP2 family protein [Candidatus Nanoarchaeia archaeon]